MLTLMDINLNYFKNMEKLIAARYYTLSRVLVDIFEKIPYFCHEHDNITYNVSFKNI